MQADAWYQELPARTNTQLSDIYKHESTLNFDISISPN